MIATARRLRAEGFDVMPHFPARSIRDRAEFRDWIDRYRAEADVREALVIAGGRKTPAGDFDNAMQLLDTGFFEDAGFTRLHVAGHPEGSRDIDPDGGTANVSKALAWKQDYARQSGARMAITTQFAFEAGGVIAWARGLRESGIDLPIHLGVAGPAKLQTLIRFAIACGVGPSISVLRKRAKDITKLAVPFEPDRLLGEIATVTGPRDGALFERVHVFPLGGIRASASYAARMRAASSAGERADRKERIR
jgi:methylenetetrahydrofolate reductase (NADPH)